MSRRFGGTIPRPSTVFAASSSPGPTRLPPSSTRTTTTTTEVVTTKTKYSSANVEDTPPVTRSTKPSANTKPPSSVSSVPNGTRPSKANSAAKSSGGDRKGGASTYSSSRNSSVAMADGGKAIRTVTTSFSKPTPSRTVRTSITTLVAKPRMKAEKESPPLFNVTNLTPASSVQKSGYRTATIPKTNDGVLPTRPSRAFNSSTTSQSKVSPAKLSGEPQSATSTLGSTASSTSFTYHSGSILKAAAPKANGSSGPSKSKATLPNPILKKTTNSTSFKKAPPPEERPIPPECVRCDICKRGFLPERLDKHQEACRKIENRPKKVFNATKMRTAGTEQESYIRRGAHKKDIPVKKSNWRAKHEEFLRNVREAKKVQEHLAKGGKLSDLPPPAPSENPDYVQCPHCGRKFNEAAAERHIPKCANILSNKKKAPATRRR